MIFYFAVTVSVRANKALSDISNWFKVNEFSANL